MFIFVLDTFTYDTNTTLFYLDLLNLLPSLIAENITSLFLQGGTTELHYSHPIPTTQPPYQQLTPEMLCGVPNPV